MRKLLVLSGLLPALLWGGCQRTAPTAASPAAPCIDTSKIRKDAVCTMQYDPVCGCDNTTYGNACQATNAGVTRYTKGACPGQ